MQVRKETRMCRLSGRSLCGGRPGPLRRACLGVALLLLWICASAFAIPRPATGYVKDDTGLLSTAFRDEVVLRNSQLAPCGAQIGVVLVPTLGGESMEETANDTFRAWGLGDAKKNNGLLILVAKEDRNIRIEVGYGLEGDIPDALAGRWIDQIVKPAFRHEAYEEGLRALVQQATAHIAAANGLQIDLQERALPAASRSRRSPFSAVRSLAPLLVILFLFMNRRTRMLAWMMLMSGNSRGGRNGGGFFGGGGGGGGSSFGGGSSGGGGAGGNW